MRAKWKPVSLAIVAPIAHVDGVRIPAAAIMHTNRAARASLIVMVAAIAGGCDKPAAPLVPAAVTSTFPSGVTAVAGTAVLTTPAVTVTTSSGKPVPNVAVTFAVKSGGGSVLGAAQTTNAEGVATVSSWTLGPTVGPNELTADVASLPQVLFTVTGIAGVPAKLAIGTPPSATAVNRVAFATQPVVQVQDVNGNLVASSTVQVTAGVQSGTGALNGTTTVSAVAGVATFTNLSVAGLAGSKVLSFSSSGLAPAQAGITTTAGPAAVLGISAGNGQSAPPNSAVAIAPAAIVTDADGNPVAGTGVTFAVTSGGGSITGANPTSGTNGLATAGTWTLGPTEGANTLGATAVGLTGSPLTFTASGTNTAIATISPATLTPGVTATITGMGFGATPASNAVTIDGAAATVTAASATSLTVTVPSLACTPAHSAVVSVNPNNTGAVVKNHPVAAATALALAVGEAAILSTATTARCNQLSNTGGLYYISVYNSNTVYDTTGARFELLGSAGSSSVLAPSNVVAAPRVFAPRINASLPRNPEMEARAKADRAHVQFLERELEYLRQNGPSFGLGRNSAALRNIAPVTTVSYAVGDAMPVRLPNITGNSCSAWIDIAGRVAYVGTRAIIIEDNANPLAGTIDTTYAQIGSEFDDVMWPILEANYGNPIVNDAALDNNGRFIMVFTDKMNPVPGSNPAASGPGHELGALGLAGFVTSVDLRQRSTCPTSNVGEYFYATSPTTAGTINTSGSPPRWRWAMRGTIIHEVKHIVSIGERFFRNGGTVFEVSWLEETTARISEELYERARYSFTQKSNIGYGSASNQVGPYCGVRLACNNARGIVRVFEELASAWYSGPHHYSPLGRINSSDFSFYATGWSMVRWFLDASSNAESAILKGMTQEPTKTSMANLEEKSGLTFAASQPRWLLSMLVDDYTAGFAPLDATIKQPSWNLRNVFSGYDADFTVPWVQWPLVPNATTFGAFSLSDRVRPGTGTAIQLSGAQLSTQLLELKASGANAAAPAELRMAIIRVQ